MSATSANTILLQSAAWSWLFHGERPTAWALAGGVLILGATTLKAILDARSSPGELARVECPT
jgi:drug/metabolite transporter (DMT)-like permease